MAVLTVEADSLTDAVAKGIERADVAEPTNVYARRNDSGLYFVKVSTSDILANRPE